MTTHTANSSTADSPAAPRTSRPSNPAMPNAEQTTGSLAAAIGAKLIGPADTIITGIAPIELAEPGQLTFIREDKYAKLWPKSHASAALVMARAEAATLAENGDAPRALLIVTDADLAMARCIAALHPDAARLYAEPGIHPTAVVHSSARIDPTASIGPHCSIGPEVSIGAETVVGANVTISDRTIIGARCRIKSGASIGGEGFAYRPNTTPSADGSRPAGPPSGLIPLPHIGHVIIEDDVDIGSNSCIDRGRLGTTHIGRGTKIDNLVQIAHNCKIGRWCIICGHCGLAGSVTLGDWVQLGGNVGIADNITIGSGVKLAAKSGVMSDIPAGETWAGVPAMPGREYFRFIASVRKMNNG